MDLKRTPRLEADAFADPEAALVYADHLIGRGDPRGALIVLQHRIDAARGDERDALEREERAYLHEHADALLGPLVEAEAAVSWQRGFARRIDVAAIEPDLLAQVMAHPSSRHVAELALDNVDSAHAIEMLASAAIDRVAVLELLLDDWLEANAVIEALAARPRPWRSLVFGTTDVHDRAVGGHLFEAWDVQPLVGEPRVAAFGKATPALRELELRGIYMFEGLVHDELRRLKLIGDAINGLPFDYLDGRVAVPALERIELELLKDEYRLATIAPLAITPANAPALRELSFTGRYDRYHSATTMLAMLSDAAILSQLSELAVSDIHRDDLDLDREQFTHLERFHVDVIRERNADVRADIERRCRELWPRLTIGELTS